MKLRLIPRAAAGLVAVVALAATAFVVVPGASAGQKAGTLDCPTLTPFNANKYALEVGTTVTCTIDGASDASGKTTVPVIIKSSQLGNTTVTGTVSGSGSSTKVTFTFTAPLGGCNTVVVAYISNGNNTSLNGGNAGGFAYVDSSGNVVTTCNAGPSYNAWLGYGDDFEPRGTHFPSPWLGSPNTIFVGCGVNPDETGGPVGDGCPQQPGIGGDYYDAGAIRIDNLTTGPLVVSGPASGPSVTIGVCPLSAPSPFPGMPAVYTPWPGLHQTIPVGGTLILTQTGLSNDPCGQSFGFGNIGAGANFDTSESAGNGNCNPTGAIPVITGLTINGVPTTITDTGQILNQGGTDPGACNGGRNEFEPWTPVGP